MTKCADRDTFFRRGRALGRIVLAVIVWIAPLAAWAEGGAFRYERRVMVGGAGYNRLLVDAELLSGSEPGAELADVRLFDRDEREVPYLLVRATPPAASWQAGRVLPVPETRDRSGFEVDLGRLRRVDRLRAGGLGAPFLKRVRLEGSGDRTRWVVLVEEATLFDLPEEKLARVELTFAEGEYRYLRLVYDDRSSQRMQPPSEVSARLVGAVYVPPEISTEVEAVRRPSERGTSRFMLRLPGNLLPVVALELECAEEHLLRPVRVLEPRLSDGEVAPADLGSTVLRRAVRGDLSAADLRIPIKPPRSAELELVIDDGNNPQLAPRSIRAVFAPQPYLVFEARENEPLVARYGRSKPSAPRYDLEAVRASVDSLKMAEARWQSTGSARPLAPGAAEVPPPALALQGAAVDTAGFRRLRRIPDGPAGLVALALDAAVVAHSEGFADLRIVDARDRQVPYLLEKRDEPLTIALEDAAQPGAPRGHSLHRLTLPYATLPSARVVLVATSRIFERGVTFYTLRKESREPAKAVLAQRVWRATDPDAAPPPLSVELPSLGTTELFVEIDDGDNPALVLGSARLELPAHRLRFFRESGASLSLLYGRADLARPRYDLTLLAPRLVGAVATEIVAGPEITAAVPSASTPVEKRIFWAVLSVVVVTLLALVGVLLRKAQPG